MTPEQLKKLIALCPACKIEIDQATLEASLGVVYEYFDANTAKIAPATKVKLGQLMYDFENSLVDIYIDAITDVEGPPSP